MKVLIIDDDQWQADLYCLELQQNAHQCVVANDAYSAISLIDNDPPDVIVLDLLLPGSNGIALLHELRSYGDLTTIPVIIISSEAVLENTLKGYGVVRTLDKTTLNQGDVLAAVEAVNT